MNFEKTKVEIFWSGDNIGCTLCEGKESLDWNELSREDQLKILNGLSAVFYMFDRHLKVK